MIYIYIYISYIIYIYIIYIYISYIYMFSIFSIYIFIPDQKIGGFTGATSKIPMLSLDQKGEPQVRLLVVGGLHPFLVLPAWPGRGADVQRAPGHARRTTGAQEAFNQGESYMNNLDLLMLIIDY